VLTLIALVLAVAVVPSPWGLILVVAAVFADVAETKLLLRWSRRRRPAVGVAGLIGRRAVAVSQIAPSGQVKVDGELWQAVSQTEIEPGESVLVRSVDGLVLTVTREGS
jgi:membrane-bound serine protease (ClpP class)